MVLGVRCDVDIFKLTASAQSINREVYESCNYRQLFTINNIISLRKGILQSNFIYYINNIKC